MTGKPNLFGTNILDPCSYVNIEVEMFEDYIRMCGQNSENKIGEIKNQKEDSSGSQKQRENRNQRESIGMDSMMKAPSQLHGPLFL